MQNFECRPKWEHRISLQPFGQFQIQIHHRTPYSSRYTPAKHWLLEVYRSDATPGHIFGMLLRQHTYDCVGGGHDGVYFLSHGVSMDTVNDNSSKTTNTHPLYHLFQVTLKPHVMKAALKKGVETGTLVKVKVRSRERMDVVGSLASPISPPACLYFTTQSTCTLQCVVCNSC